MSWSTNTHGDSTDRYAAEFFDYSQHLAAIGRQLRSTLNVAANL